MEKKLKIIGVFSIVFGSISVLLCLIPFGIFLAILAGFIGMLFSTVYIFIDNRYEITNKKLTPGLIGIILSSTPVLLIIVFNIIKHFKN